LPEMETEEFCKLTENPMSEFILCPFNIQMRKQNREDFFKHSNGKTKTSDYQRGKKFGIFFEVYLSFAIGLKAKTIYRVQELTKSLGVVD
jgi:hypothetical protein